MDLKAVGQRIKAAREAKNLTQEELAALVNLSTTHVSVIERGLKVTKLDTFVAIANTDQVKSGGMFNKTIEDCIVLYHPEHQYDYFKICVRVSHQGSYAFVSAMDFGTSKQMKKAGQAEAYRADRKGKSMSYKVGSMIGQGLTSIGRSKSKLEEEQNYYACIIDIFDEIVS